MPDTTRPQPSDETSEALDPIPLEDTFVFTEPNEAGMSTAMFYAFNTVITLQAFGDANEVRAAMEAARDRCRFFERLFSRTLPHSDIARLNAAAGAETPLHPETFRLLQAAQHYCAESQGTFDVTIGAAGRLWNFHEGVMPSEDALAQAVKHVDWHTLVLREESGAEESTPRCFARLEDPQASVDAGGIAKGYIADDLTALLSERGVQTFIVNLGGNVVSHGVKPNGAKWKIGVQDPKRKDGILGAIQLGNASAVTSGVYERCFERDGTLYHHILDPRTGMPVETDAAGVTVVADASLDAEGFSTTLVALGIKEGAAFVDAHPQIRSAYFVDHHDRVIQVP